MTIKLLFLSYRLYKNFLIMIFFFVNSYLHLLFIVILAVLIINSFNIMTQIKHKNVTKNAQRLGISIRTICKTILILCVVVLFCFVVILSECSRKVRVSLTAFHSPYCFQIFATIWIHLVEIPNIYQKILPCWWRFLCAMFTACRNLSMSCSSFEKKIFHICEYVWSI